MHRVFCNSCYTLFNKEKLFSLTSCGHVYCSACLPAHGNRDNNCKICKRKFVKMFISKQMPVSTQMLFNDLRRSVASFQKVIRFQSEQSDFYVAHLLKENERLRRLVSCFKKRVDFLKKNCSLNATRTMYKTIKQEPNDDVYNEFNGNGQVNDNFNKELKPDQFINVAWKVDTRDDNIENKISQFVKNPEFAPEQNENELAAETRRIGINFPANITLTQLNKQRTNAAQNQQNFDHIKQWNRPQTIYNPLNFGIGIENRSNPQPTRQATIDQFFLRGNSSINSLKHMTGENFPLKTQMTDITGLGNFQPTLAIATRLINSSTLNLNSNGL